ncbi:sensor histidine kinase [Roseibium marinum]|nr:sensor histidine kinase [Roseibium marinum]
MRRLFRPVPTVVDITRSLLFFTAVLFASNVTSIWQLEAAAGQLPAIGAGPEFASASLTGRMSVLRDPDHAISLADVAFGAAGQAMHPASGNIALGYTQDALWVKFSLKRDRAWPLSLFLNLIPTYLDRVDVYVARVAHPASVDDFELLRLGDHVPSAERAIFVPSLVAELTLPDADLTDIYMRMETTSNLALRGWVLSGASMLNVATQESIKLGAILSFFIILAIIHLYYFFFLRKRLYFSFSAFLVALASVFLFDSGLITDGPMLGVYYASDLYLGCTMIIAQLTSYVFMIDQLEARARFPILYRGLQGMIALYAFVLVAAIAGYGSTVIPPALALSTSWILLVSVYNVILYRRKRPGSGLATMAYLILLAGFVATAGRLSGLLPFATATEHAFLAGVVLFIFFMNLSLLQRARLAEQRRRESQALQVSRKAEKAAMRLVKIRTAELETAKEEAETALAHERAAQAEQLRFVDVVTHQYQTPLAVIRSSIAAILQTLAPQDEGNRQRVSQIRSAVKRLIEVLDVSLHRSRVDGSTAKANLQDVELVPTLEGIVGRNRELSPESGLEIEFQSIGAHDRGRIDPDMLGLALTNLIDNAVKFSAAGKPVRMRCRRQDGSLVIEVADEGIGIPEAEREDISKRYFRASNTGGIPGTGLGLHIVRAVAAAHGGTFAIANGDQGGVVTALTIPA